MKTVARDFCEQPIEVGDWVQLVVESFDPKIKEGHLYQVTSCGVYECGCDCPKITLRGDGSRDHLACFYLRWWSADGK